MSEKIKCGWVVGKNAAEESVILYLDRDMKWSQQNCACPNFDVGGLVALDDQNVFVVGGQNSKRVTRGVTLATKNGGDDWDIIPEADGSPAFSSLCKIGNTLWAGGFGGKVFRCDNYNELNWIPVSPGDIPYSIQVQGIACPSENVVWAVGNGTDPEGLGGGVWKWTTASQKWTRFNNIPVPPSNASSAEKYKTAFIGVWAFSEEEVIAYGTCGLCVKTKNGGQDWESLMDLGGTMVPDNNGFWAIDRQNLFMARDRGHLQYSTKGGTPTSTWKEFDNLKEYGQFFFLDVCVLGANIWVVGELFYRDKKSPAKGIYLYSSKLGNRWDSPIPQDIGHLNKICIIPA